MHTVIANLVALGLFSSTAGAEAWYKSLSTEEKATVENTVSVLSKRSTLPESQDKCYM